MASLVGMSSSTSVGPQRIPQITCCTLTQSKSAHIDCLVSSAVMTLSALVLAGDGMSASGGVDGTRVAGRRGKVRARNGLALGEEPAVHEGQRSSVVSVEMHPRHPTGCRRFNFRCDCGQRTPGNGLFRLRADGGGLHTFPLPPGTGLGARAFGLPGPLRSARRAPGNTRRWTCSLADDRFDRQEPHAAQPRLHRWATP